MELPFNRLKSHLLCALAIVLLNSIAFWPQDSLALRYQTEMTEDKLDDFICYGAIPVFVGGAGAALFLGGIAITGLLLVAAALLTPMYCHISEHMTIANADTKLRNEKRGRSILVSPTYQKVSSVKDHPNGAQVRVLRSAT